MEHESESEDEFPAYFEEHFEVGSVVEEDYETGSWYSVAIERLDTQSAHAVMSLESFHDVAEGATPISRFLSVLGSLRPHTPHGLSAVPLALRHAKFRLTQGLSAGVRGIRRCLTTHGRAPHLRTTLREPTPAPPRRPTVWVTARAIYDTSITIVNARRLPEECTACQVEISVRHEATRVPCGHIYHSECLLMLVEIAMQTPAQFPPRCCRRPIPIIRFRPLLDPVQREAFRLLQVERATPRPLYCANPRCSRFLGERDKRTPVRVHPCRDRTCTTRTCARCKAAVERDENAQTHVCAYDAGHRAVVRLGTQNGWTRCPGCEQLVERNGGCWHMTCRCGAEFCYSCGRKHGGCVCGQRRADFPEAARPYVPQLVVPQARLTVPLAHPDWNYERPPFAREADEQLEASPLHHAAGVGVGSARPDSPHPSPASREYPRIWVDQPDVMVHLASPPPFSAGSTPYSEDRTLDDVQEETTPDSPASSEAPTESSLVCRKGELAQQARAGSIRRTS